MTAPLRTSDPIVVDVALGERSYQIAIGRGLIASLGQRITALRPGAKAAVVSDETVAKLHLEAALAALDRAGLKASTVVVAPGESSKSFSVLEEVCEALIAARIERADLVVAFGGGVIGDLAGLAAAVVRRGLDYVQVPTTLLAQVDSSVGGKTAIDSRQGKNLVGAFHQPILVIADTALLDTLPARQFRAGYAEVAKYGLIADAAFFAWLEANWQEIFSGGPAREHAIAVSARPASARCTISVTPSATRSKPPPASPTGCCMARRSRSAWSWRSSSRRAAGWCPWPTPIASGATWPRSACRRAWRRLPAARRAPIACWSSLPRTRRSSAAR